MTADACANGGQVFLNVGTTRPFEHSWPRGRRPLTNIEAFGTRLFADASDRAGRSYVGLELARRTVASGAA